MFKPDRHTSFHWLGDRHEAEATSHAMDMRGCVAYFERQSDCLEFMRRVTALSTPSPDVRPLVKEGWQNVDALKAVDIIRQKSSDGNFEFERDTVSVLFDAFAENAVKHALAAAPQPDEEGRT
jgi:hypothetical protein